MKILPSIALISTVVPSLSLVSEAFTPFSHAAASIRQVSLLHAHGPQPQPLSSPPSRRIFLTNALTVATTAQILHPIQPAMADVSDGDLPQGAAQFARILRTKSDLVLVTKRVRDAAPEDISKEEWDNVGKFLRQIYTAAGDMKKLGIADPVKKKRGLELTQLMEKLAQAGDVTVTKQDKDKLLVILDKTKESFDEFFDLLRDVPDEI